MNRPLSELFKYNFRSGSRYLNSQTVGKAITVFTGALLALLVGIGLYRFGVVGLRYIQGYILYKDAFTLYLYELYLAVIFYITSFGSLMFLLFTLLKSSNDNWILVTPKFTTLPWYYFGKITASTMTTISILAIPLLLAIYTVFNISIPSAILMFFIVIVFILTGILFSMVLVFGSSKILYYLSKNGKLLSLGKVLIISIIVLVGLLVIGWQRAIPKDIVEFWQIPITDVRQFNTDIVKERFVGFPSHYPATYLYSLQKGDSEEAITSFAVSYGILSVMFVLFMLAKTNFLPIWQKLQEGSFEARAKLRNGRFIISKKFPVILKSPIGALFEKEFLVIVRDLKNITWIGFVFSLWLIYTGINLLIKRAIDHYDLGINDITEAYAIYALQISIGIYFITAFVLRFVFPSFSTERKTSWIIGTSPVNLKNILYSKFFFFSTVLVIVGFVISIFNFQIFKPELLDTFIYVMVFLTTVITITLQGLFLGIVFPNFESDDPEVLGTSVPGIILTLLGILYGAIGSVIIYTYLQTGNLLYILAFEGLSALIIVVTLKLTPKYLKRIEFAENMLIA